MVITHSYGYKEIESHGKVGSADIPSQKGKLAVVTGATGGLDMKQRLGWRMQEPTVC